MKQQSVQRMAETSSPMNDEALATSETPPVSIKNPEETVQNVQDPAPVSFSCLAKSVDLGGKEEDFLKGCRFSPDGLCVLTASCHRLLLYNSYTPSQDWKSVLSCETGDAVRSYTWYPHMNSADPSTCCFLGTSRDQPVHLYDAYTGAIRSTYRPINNLDEMESPNVVCFSHNGQNIVTSGFRSDRMLHIFDLHRPGRESTRLQLGKTRRSRDGQKGLGSALAASSASNLLAVGTYSPGSIYLYDDRAQSTEVATIITGTCVVGHGKAHGRKTKHYFLDDELSFSAAKVQWYQNRARGGVTQLEFHQDQCSLFSSSRRSDAVLQWDLRRLSSHAGFCPGVASYATDNETNQRLEFALKDSQIWIGGRDKCVRVYSQTCKKLMATLEDLPDVANGVSLSTQASGKTLLAVSCGSRQFPSEDDLDEEDPSMYPSGTNELRLFEVANPAVGA